MSSETIGAGPAAVGRAYLSRLTVADLDLVAAATGSGDAEALRAAPVRIEGLLAEQATFDAVFRPVVGEAAPLVGVSPFLAFAVAIQRGWVELGEAPYLREWTGPRQRIPVFVTDELRGFAGDPEHRLFLADLLASFTHVAGGKVTTRRHGVAYRRRFSELDLTALAGLLEVASEQARPAVYRRLGDLALLLTGVFPDHTALTRFAPIEVDRLARAIDPAGPRGEQRAQLLDALAARGAVGLLEQLGQRWYRLALAGADGVTTELATLRSVGERFLDARRILNHVTDRHLFPFRGSLFPSVN